MNIHEKIAERQKWIKRRTKLQNLISDKDESTLGFFEDLLIKHSKLFVDRPFWVKNIIFNSEENTCDVYWDWRGGEDSEVSSGIPISFFEDPEGYKKTLEKRERDKKTREEKRKQDLEFEQFQKLKQKYEK
jgi:hypothetical protein